MSVLLEFIAPHADAADRQRGLHAAELFLRRAGIAPADAFRGAEARTVWGDSGLAPMHAPSPEDLVHADAWDGALESALLACYRGGNAPFDACLRLVQGA